MSVDDIAAQGAEPLFFLDYISIGKLVPDEIDEIVSGVAEGCRRGAVRAARRRDVGAPGRDGSRASSISSASRSASSSAREVLPPRRARRRSGRSGSRVPGCGATATRSPAAALLERAGLRLDEPALAGRRHSLADELLDAERRSTRPRCWSSRRHVEVHAFAHVTGGGIPGNLARVLPDRCDAVVERGRWEEPRIFAEIQRAGDVADDEMEHVFNLGVGMLAVVADAAERASTSCGPRATTPGSSARSSTATAGLA